MRAVHKRAAKGQLGKLLTGDGASTVHYNRWRSCKVKTVRSGDNGQQRSSVERT